MRPLNLISHPFLLKFQICAFYCWLIYLDYLSVLDGALNFIMPNYELELWFLQI